MISLIWLLSLLSPVNQSIAATAIIAFSMSDTLVSRIERHNEDNNLPINRYTLSIKIDTTAGEEAVEQARFTILSRCQILEARGTAMMVATYPDNDGLFDVTLSTTLSAEDMTLALSSKGNLEIWQPYGYDDFLKATNNEHIAQRITAVMNDYDYRQQNISLFHNSLICFMDTNEPLSRNLAASIHEMNFNNTLPEDAVLAKSSSLFSFDSEPEDVWYILRKTKSDNGAIVSLNDLITDVRINDGQYGGQEVLITLNKEGAVLFERITADHVGKKLPFVVDSDLISAPIVNSTISGGKLSILLNNNISRAKVLKALLKTNQLTESVSISLIES